MFRPGVKLYVPKVKRREELIQRRVCTYLRKEYPHVLFHSDYSAGLGLTENQAKINKSLQWGPGWPDVFIAHPSRGYHGLFLELKKEGVTIKVKIGPRKGELVANEHIQQQARVHELLKKDGYLAGFAVGFDHAVKIIDWYFERPENASLF